MFKNFTGQKLTVYVFDSTTNLPKTGDAANLTAYRSLDDGSVTVLADTSATEQDSTNAKGFYTFDLAQAETNGDKIVFTCKSITADMVCLAMPAVVYTTPPYFSSQAIDVSGNVSATAVGGTVDTVDTVTDLTNPPPDSAGVTTLLANTPVSEAAMTTLLEEFAATRPVETYAAEGEVPTRDQLMLMIERHLSEFTIVDGQIIAMKFDKTTPAMTYDLVLDGSDVIGRTRTTGTEMADVDPTAVSLELTAGDEEDL